MKIINDKHKSLSELKSDFVGARPFPYIVLDDFLDERYYLSLIDDFNNSDSKSAGRNFDTDVETNKWISLNTDIPKSISSIVDFLNTDSWVGNLIQLTGITTLVPTTIGNTKLANYHEMKSNGFLAPHVDHSQDPDAGLPHVLNIIIYLSSEWDSSYGGATLFYDKTGRKLVSKVEYKPNRAIVFLHTPYSFHCVEKIKDNLPVTRKSLYVDYYSRSRKPYETFDLDFPGRWFKHNTTFVLNNYHDYFKYKNINYTKAYLRYLLNRFI